MRPFRSRALAAIVFAILVLGMLGTVANAAQIPSRNSFPEDPWAASRNSFPEDPWTSAN
ncbi:MAG: hypothetical protein AABM32_05340 [Chloroflexota bacterium]